MNPKLYVMIIVFLSFLQFTTSRNNETNVQYIIPVSNVSACPANHHCMTITQSFESFVIDPNPAAQLVLYFLPGEHILDAHNYSMAGASNMQLLGLPSSKRNVELICNGDGKIFFDQVQILRLKALHFISNKGKTFIIEVLNSHKCELIDIVSINTSIYLQSLTSMRAENVVISNAVSGRNMIIVEKCMGVLSNITIENNTATAPGPLGPIVKIMSSTLHINGFLYAANNSYIGISGTSLIWTRNTYLQVGARLVFTQNVKFGNLWSSFSSYINFQFGELIVHHNLDIMVNVLMLRNCTFIIEQQAKINVSDNVSRDSTIMIFFYSFMEANGTTSIYNNYAENSLIVMTNSCLTLAGNASFVNNINVGLGGTGGCVIFIASRSHLYTNATVIFEDNTGISGSGIGAVNSGILFNGITKFMNNSATEGGAIHINEAVNINDFTISIHFQGLTIFANNSATKAGAVYCHGKNINLSFRGSTIFTGNSAQENGAHLTLLYCNNCTAYFSGSTTVEKGRSLSLLGGTITASGDSSIIFSGMNIFTQNSAKAQNILIEQGAKFQCYGRSNFTGNEGAVFKFSDNAIFVISGTILFDSNFNPPFYVAEVNINLYGQ